MCRCGGEQLVMVVVVVIGGGGGVKCSKLLQVHFNMTNAESHDLEL